MKNKNGFTLIELLGVITIFGILCALAIPPILNQVNNNKDVISEANLKIIYHATHLYFDGETGANGNYCVTLQQLVDRDLLEAPIQDFETDKEIALTRSVKMTTNANKKESYQLLKEGEECVVSSIPSEYEPYTYNLELVSALKSGALTIADESQFSVSGTTLKYNGTNHTKIVVPATINGVSYDTIGAATFMDATITEIYLPNTVQTLETYTFTQNINLKNIVLPPSIKTMGSWVFSFSYGAKPLETIKFTGTTVPTIVEGTSGTFRDLTLSTNKIYVPSSALNNYRAAWSSSLPAGIELVGY